MKEYLTFLKKHKWELAIAALVATTVFVYLSELWEMDNQNFKEDAELVELREENAELRHENWNLMDTNWILSTEINKIGAELKEYKKEEGKE